MIYIQATGNIPHHFDAACALYGARELGMDYKLVYYDDLRAGIYDSRLKSNLFVGSVEFMQEVFKRVFGEDLPKDGFLKNSSNVSECITTLHHARKHVLKGMPLFIKPTWENMKSFSGMVFKDETDLSCIKNINGNTRVITAGPYTGSIYSEWRVYIHRGEVKGIKNYSGAHYLPPNEIIIEKNLSKLENPPIAFCLDIAMTLIADGADTKSELVEYTDMYAVGNYGLENDVYLTMLKDRYFEIMNKT